MKEEYDIETLNPRRNPYTDKLNNSQEIESDSSEKQNDSDIECHHA